MKREGNDEKKNKKKKKTLDKEALYERLKTKVQIAAVVTTKAVDKFLPKYVYWGFKVSTIYW